MTHYSYSDMYEATTAGPITLVLAEGDTADLPGTSKKYAQGPGQIIASSDPVSGLFFTMNTCTTRLKVRWPDGSWNIPA